MAFQNRPPLIISAPPGGRISAPDIFPNLLLTTLLLVPIGLPLSAGRVDASAPAIKAPVRIDDFVKRPSQQLGINPNAFIQRLDASAPQAKYAVQVDRAPWPITLGVVTTLPAVHGLSASAPRTKIDVTAFMRVSTILPTPPFVIPPDNSQFQPKYSVFDTNAATQRSLALGINPDAFIQRLDAGAPFPKYQVQLDRYPNLTTLTLAPTVNVIPQGKQLSVLQLQVKYAVEVDPAPYPLGLAPAPLIPPLVGRLSVSAPTVKYQPQVDVYPRLLLYLPGPPLPAGKVSGRSIDTELPQLKYAVQVDRYPDLLATTLHPREVPVPLPLGLLHDFQLPQLKYQIRFDTYPNLLLPGIPVILVPDLCKQLYIDSRPFAVQIPIRTFAATLNGRPFSVSWEC